MSNKKDEKPIFALVVLGILFVIMLGIICTIHMIKFKCRRRDEPNITRGEKGMKRLIVSLQSVAVCCYFFGDNFYYVMNRYGGCLPKCGEKCIRISYYVAIGFSGAAAIIYAIVKVLQLAIKDDSGQGEQKVWINFLPMIAVVAEMDLLYTIASSKLNRTDEADETDEAVASGFLLGIAIIIGIILIWAKAKNLSKKISRSENQITNWRCKIIVMSIIIVIPLMFHTLGDNLEPLDSINGIKCDFGNSTANCQAEISCETNTKIRLGLATVSQFIILSLASCCLFNWVKSHDKWVQYKQDILEWWQRRRYKQPENDLKKNLTVNEASIYS